MSENEPLGSLGNKFINSKGMISMNCWFDINIIILYPLESKIENMVAFRN